MAFCPKCGEVIPGTTKKCLRCGISIAQGIVAGDVDGPEERKPNTRAPIVTGATTTIGGLKKVDPSSNQWSTFQTAAQKQRGITHEQSMQEIDEFVGKGAASERGPAATASGAVDDIQEVEVSEETKKVNELLKKNCIVKGDSPSLGSAHVMNASGIDPSRAFGANRGKGGPPQVTKQTTVTETTYHMEGPKKDGLIGFGSEAVRKLATPKTDAAAAFLTQYKDAEAAKFKPQKDGKYR